MKIDAVILSAAESPHARLAAEALRSTAAVLGHDIAITVGADAAADDGGGDPLLVVGDGPYAPPAGRTARHASLGETIRDTRAILTELAGAPPPTPVDATGTTSSPASETPSTGTTASPEVTPRRIVGITSCPTGIAHTFMAAEALQKAAAALGHSIKVETQGSVGAQNQLTPEEIAAADAVVIAADTNVDTSRFAGKRLFVTGTKDAMRNGRDVLASALALPEPASGEGLASSVAAAKEERSKGRRGPYRHLMTGVSYMLPVVIAGGLAIALSFAVGGIYAGEQEGTLGWALAQIGGGAAFQLFVAVLSGYIAFSIADRPGIAAGLIGGLLAHTLGAGFLGGILSGFIAGYLTRFLSGAIRLPATLEGLKPVLILPFLSSITVGLLMIYLVAPPVQALNAAMNEWLLGMRGANALLLGLLLGGMMAVDMGGPVNKAAYTFAVGLLASSIYGPMAAVMAAGITPPLGLALAVLLMRRRFDEDEREASGAAAVLGVSFITEGAIPFAAKDPIRVIPALVAGSAVAGALSMLFGVELLVPHGGVFAALIPGAVDGLLPYLGAIVAGTLVTAIAVLALKRAEPEST